MKPYSNRGMNRAEMIANYRISRSILSSRFRVFHEAIVVHPDRVKDIVLCCVVLHNMLRSNRGAGGRERDLGG